MAEPGASLQGRRVLVTGHTGFKGSWLTLWLRQLGALVSGLSLPAASPSLYLSMPQDDLQHDYMGDIRDRDLVDTVVQQTRPEIVFHLAAQALVRAGHRDPVATFGTNVMGTVHLLDAIRRCEHTRAVVVVTTDKCYAPPGPRALQETDRLGGSGPYSASKASAELVVSSYRDSFFAPQRQTLVATARAGNVIGGGDWGAERLLPDLVRAHQTQQDCVLRNPQAVRPWQHVLDPLAGYLMLCEALLSGDEAAATAFNFGPSDEGLLTVAELAAAFDKHWGRVRHRCAPAANGPAESHQLRLSSDKARRALGWSPRLSTAEAVAWTARWYRDQASATRMLKLPEREPARERCLADLAAWHAAPAMAPRVSHVRP